MNTFIREATNMTSKNELVKKLVNTIERYSPVVITGAHGTGKTYFLEKLCSALGKDSALVYCSKAYCDSPNTINIFTGAYLVDSLIDTIKNGTGIIEWQMKLLASDIIIIDDFDFVADKEAAQENLANVFQYTDKPIIVTANKPLSSMSFSDRLLGIFSEGIHIRFSEPTKDEIREALESLMTEYRLCISEEAKRWLIEQDFGNYFRIKGFVTMLSFYFHTGDSRVVDLEMCRKVAGDFPSTLC